MQVLTSLAVTTEEGGWRPGIGDPTVMGWLIVGAYLIALVCCVRCWMVRHRYTLGDKSRRYRFFWALMVLLVLFLGINKQLDLQTWFGQAARGFVKEQGWYEQRRELQRWFIVGISLVAGLLVLLTLWLMGPFYRTLWVTVLGAGILACFVVVRAASFHKMDYFLGKSVLGPVDMNHVMELVGIVVLTLGTVMNADWFGSRQEKTPH